MSDVGTPAGETQPVPGAPLFVVKGDATAEEVAALAAVLQGIAAAEVSAPARGPGPEWSAHHRERRWADLLRLGHSGMFPCFLGGSVSRLVRSSRSTRVTSARVSCGVITAST